MNTLDLFSLKNKTAVVTGSLGLLGQQHCIALSEAGANVIVTDLNEADCIDFANQLQTKSIGVYCDITNPESLENVITSSMKHFKTIDILVNNAAINDMVENPSENIEQTKFENYPLDLFRKVIDVNVTGMFLTSQIIGKQMLKQGKGSIINIASMYGIVAPNQSLYLDENRNQMFYKSAAYPTAKGAVLSFTTFLAAYWAKNGIRVNAISPGGIENNQPEYFLKNYSERVPLQRMAKSNDFKAGLIYLSSDASEYVTGANLVIDGGWTIW